MKIKRLVLSAFAVVAIIFSLPFQLNMVEGKAMDKPFKANEQEVLWLARAIASESRRDTERTIIAWVIRNRVENHYRGNTYKEVVLSDSQFSGLHPSDKNYKVNISRDESDTDPSWQKALDISRAVYSADESLRPIPKTVLHFYSPRSASRAPEWATGSQAVYLIRDNSEGSVRFAFYQGIK